MCGAGRSGGMKRVNTNTHPLFDTCGGGGLLLYLGGERVDDMCDPRRLEHHLRSITLGFVCEFCTQFIDVDILKSHQRSVPGTVKKNLL